MSLIAFATLAALTSADGGTPVLTPDGGTPLVHPGEDLSYELTILGAGAGALRIVVGDATPMDGAQTWPIVASVQTTGPFDHVFSVRDRVVSWWDPTRQQAVAARITASEGSNRYGYFMHFRRTGPQTDAGIPVDNEHWDGKTTDTRSEVLDPQVEDFLTAVFWLRTRPLATGEVDALPIFMGQTQWQLVSRVVGTENVTVGSAPVRAVHVRLSAKFNGPLGNKRDLDAFFTDDASHVPVLLDSELFVGHVQARLSRLPQ